MNLLAKESSPYLLQHKDNPVEWYPWGPEALERAKRENKPILLSVGYSACHWCHVMAHESFENAEIAALMNQNFVNIKVDREERPDLDQIYQNVAMALTQGGGWPLTVFLTPDLKPYFGGTYFPPEDRYGRPGFPRVLAALAAAYRDDHANVQENAKKLTDYISQVEAVRSPAGEGPAPSLEALVEAARKLVDVVDWIHGGLGSAPKFPNPMVFSLLWRVGAAIGDEKMREATLLTLEKMARGGIYDQLGGGFSRYSVDHEWAVPHFEKMLYDNGLLLKLYAEVLLAAQSGMVQVSEERKALFARVLEETVEYLLREMRTPEGAFYAAQDADSEGEEGKFFVWDPSELTEVLTPDEAIAASRAYGVTSHGNFEHGKTVLYLTGAALVTDPLVASARKKLFAARSKRVAPGRDDKVLASWNGLAISGLSWAAAALERQGRAEVASRAREAAEGAFDFLAQALDGGEGRLHATYQGDRAKHNGYLDDYAFLAAAALDLARFTRAGGAALDGYLAHAERWIWRVLKHFRDSESPGYFFTSDDHESLIQRPKTLHDQAIPSGTSVVLGCLSALAEMVPQVPHGAVAAPLNDRGPTAAEFARELERQLSPLFGVAARSSYGCAELLSAALLELQGPIVMSGRGSEGLADHWRVFRKGSETPELLVCHKRACGLPARDAAEALGQVRAHLSQR